MDLKQHLTGLEGPLAVEVAYLLFRYLTHRRDDQAFRALFLMERPTQYSERAYEIALAAIHDIEEREGSNVASFSEPTLRSYIDRLAELSSGLQPARADPELRARAERELELFRSM